jgi:hypothetical protein
MERAAANNLTIFLNHSYNVPEDVGGSVESARIKTRGVDHVGNPRYDLELDILVNEANPRAVQTFEAIERGTKLGLSIGAMIPEGGATRDKKSGAYTIGHVDLLETSLVGIPANPHSWVEYAVKSLKAKEPTVPEVSGLPARLWNSQTSSSTSVDMTVFGDTSRVILSDGIWPDIQAGCPSCGKSKGAPDCDDEYHEKAAEPDVETDAEPEATANTEPDTTDAAATITLLPDGSVELSATTDDNSPQEAVESSTPGAGAVVDSAEPDEEPAAPVAFTGGAELMSLLTQLTDATRELATMKIAAEAEKAARLSAETERDRTIKGAFEVLKDTKRLIDKIADSPLPRKTQFLAAQAEFTAKYGGVIDEEVMKMLLR